MYVAVLFLPSYPIISGLYTCLSIGVPGRSDLFMLAQPRSECFDSVASLLSPPAHSVCCIDSVREDMHTPEKKLRVLFDRLLPQHLAGRGTAPRFLDMGSGSGVSENPLVDNMMLGLAPSEPCDESVPMPVHFNRPCPCLTCEGLWAGGGGAGRSIHILISFVRPLTTC